MPISRKQFELGVDDKVGGLMRKIHNFVLENEDKAFTVTELREAVGGTSTWPKGEWDAFWVALQKLVELKALEMRKIQEETYFTASSGTIDI